MATIRLDKKTKTIKVVNRKDNLRLQRIKVDNVRLQHTGKTGPVGPQGPAGPGVAAGGTSGQILAKIDATDYNTEWIDNYTEEIRHYVKNDSGGVINKGEAVYLSGADGNNQLVKKALATSDLTSSKTLGLAADTIPKNGHGYIIVEGSLTNIDTSAAGAAGDPIYLSGTTPGGLIYGYANKPHAPIHLVTIGIVTRKNANTGEIFIHVQNGFELEELHDVATLTVTNNQTLKYDSATSLWKNHTLVKGDVGLGNVDNTSDSNKPISTATQTALDGKVDENAAITPSTKTKITYDAKGLVTAGADAAIADITGLQTALDNKLDDTQLDTDGTLTANSDTKIASQKATKTYADTKVTANNAITGATKTKITYDSKGLVTAGADAGISDITGLQNALDLKAPLESPTFTGTVILPNQTVTSAMIANGAIIDEDINATANIALSKLAIDPLARANHTGTQTASTISNFDTQVHTSRLDQLAAPTSSVSLNTQKIISLATPTNATDAATKQYVDSKTSGLTWKQAVNLFADVNVALTGVDTTEIDGHDLTTANGYRVLLTAQNTDTENGIYDVAVSSGNYTFTRSSDADAYAELVGASVFVMEGTNYSSTSWVQSNHYLSSFASQQWVQFSGQGTYLAGNGLSLNGNVFSLDTVVSADVSTAQTLLNKTLEEPILDTPTINDPIGLTAFDVGLGNVDNTSDLDMPISTATQAALDTKVDENSPITGATKTKITYDSKGLVTAGADAGIADITGLQTALDNKLDDTQLDTDGTLSANLDTNIASQKATKTYVDTGLGTKEPTIAAGTTGQYWRGDKSWQTLDKTAVGLGNVTNDAQVPKSAFTAKGDVLVGTGTGAYTALTLGIDGQAIVADASTASGVKWGQAGKIYYKYVVAASGGDYTTLQAALAAASAGDTIFVKAGTYALTANYSNNLNNISIIGENAQTTIIDCSTYFLTLSGTNVTIENLGFTCGSGTPTAAAVRMTGTNARFIGNIMNSSVRNLMLNCAGYVAESRFIQSSSTNNSGYMIELSASRATFVDNYVEAPFTGTGRIIWHSSDQLIVSRNRFRFPTADTNQTIVFQLGDSGLAEGNTIEAPSASTSSTIGIGIQMSGSNPRAIGNYITGGFEMCVGTMGGNYGTITERGLIANNVVLANSSSTAGVGCIKLNSAGSNGLGSITVVGNNVRAQHSGSGGFALQITNGGAGSNPHIIVGNRFQASNQVVDIQVGDSTIFSSNYVIGGGNTGGSNVMSVSASRLVITNNFFSNKYDTAFKSLNVSTNTTHVIKNNILEGRSGEYQAHPAQSVTTNYLKNTSGTTSTAGSVVILKSVAAGDEVTTTTTLGDSKVFGVINEAVSNNQFGPVITRGRVTNLRVNGTTDIAIGDFLSTYSEAGIAAKASNGHMVFAIALAAYTTNDSLGSISAILIDPFMLAPDPMYPFKFVASDPVSVTDGATVFNTTDNLLKMSYYGEWYTIADLSASMVLSETDEPLMTENNQIINI